ncbi:hypothetical protein SCUCBS95973_005859 [Sporothrix curviconia]|uniref:Uncharacterized protein n=1 Tax=Sporothrix curviconia TaxID=1260050 RepID=A0ABP0C197_9PEZI
MVTLLSALTSRNPLLDTSRVSEGPNTESADKSPLTWIPWEEFSYDNLMAIFEKQVSARYEGPSTSLSDALPLDLQICNEQTFELALHRFIMPTVNHCLDVSSTKPHYGPGSRCPHPSAKPDWSCIGRGKYCNYVPGDTKLSAKFWPSMLRTHILEWKKVVGQVVAYQAKYASRYGFIITDEVLIVMRLTREGTADGIAAGRMNRLGTSHGVDYNDGEGDSFVNTTASFVDNNPMDWELNPPEYAIVPWSAHGRKRLTVKLALWCLAMLAVKGGNHIDYSYPELNSWRLAGDRYIHNSSGVSKRHLRQRVAIQSHGLYESAGWNYEEGEASSSGQGQSGYGYGESGDNEDEYNEDNEHDEDEHDDDDEDDEDEENDDGDQDDDIHNNEPDDEVYANVGNADDTGGDAESSTYEGEGVAGPVHDHVSDTETIVAGVRLMRVTIKKRLITRKPYYVDARGREVNTDISEWTRVRHHYELRDRRRVYVADTFPL